MKLGISCQDQFKCHWKHIDKMTERLQHKCRKPQRQKAKARILMHHKHLKDKVKEMNDKIVNYIVKNAGTIVAPIFKVKSLLQSDLPASVKRYLQTLSHYEFRQRMITKVKNSNIRLLQPSEAYTSRICGCCFNDHIHLGSKEMFLCPICDVKTDCDAKSSR
eukprot:Sdes_comp20994_c0_seq5m19709